MDNRNQALIIIDVQKAFDDKKWGEEIILIAKKILVKY
ncbi:hypothetical protein SAMN05421787_105142 [Virgibacillus pantothenticus]|nr:hypothetical protein SAMN05421787_105142 [Virgibacillus pantothenticus]